jgi:hypothetical protein
VIANNLNKAFSYSCPASWFLGLKIKKIALHKNSIFVKKKVILGNKNREFYAGFETVNMPLEERLPKKIESKRLKHGS